MKPLEQNDSSHNPKSDPPPPQRPVEPPRDKLSNPGKNIETRDNQG